MCWKGEAAGLQKTILPFNFLHYFNYANLSQINNPINVKPNKKAER